MPLLRILAIVLVSIAPVTAFADWNAAQRTEFKSDCVASCSTNPRLPAEQRKNCPVFCECFQAGAEQQFKNYDTLNRDLAAAAPDSDLKKRFGAIAPACNKKAFSAEPASKEEPPK